MEQRSTQGFSGKLFFSAREDPTFRILPAMQREFIVLALKETRGNQAKAAKLLGLTPGTLRRRVRDYRIERHLVIH